MSLALLPASVPVVCSAVEESTGDATPAPGAGTNSASITYMHRIPQEPMFIGQPLHERRDVPWLGISTEEAPEVLASQLNLDPGVGLVITFIAEDSPAAKAGLERNDLLVAFEDQALVLPAQLRKLVQSRKEGDAVRLTYYRNGKKEKVEATLGKSQVGAWGDPEGWKDQLRGLEKQWRDLNVGEALREPLAQMRESLGELKINQQEMQEQIRRAVEQARQAANNPEVREQVRRSMEEARKALEEAKRSIATIPVPPAHPGLEPFEFRAPKVTVRSSGESQQSVVQTDDTGTYVVVRNPKLRLTAHDREGKLLFDGEIETDEQRAAVPAEVWKKAEPLVQRLTTPHAIPGPPPFPAPPAPATGSAPRPGTI